MQKVEMSKRLVTNIDKIIFSLLILDMVNKLIFNEKSIYLTYLRLKMVKNFIILCFKNFKNI